MHDGVYATDKLVHTYDLLQVLLRELQNFEDVEAKEIVPLIRYNNSQVLLHGRTLTMYCMQVLYGKGN